MDKTNKILKTVLILLLVIMIAGCVDKSESIKFCADKGMQYYGRAGATSCDIICINSTSSEFFFFDGKCDIMIKRG